MRKKWITLRFRKRDVEHNLRAAVTHWVRAHGGRCVVTGGIEVQKWPDDYPYSFRIALRCTGKLPKLQKKAKC